MNNTDLNRLTNALLTAYLDKKSSDEVVAICTKFNIVIGSKIFRLATDRVERWIEEGEYDLMNDYNREKITQQGLQNLAKQHGAVLGKDYSKTEDGYIFSSDLITKIKAGMPPSDWETFESQGYIKTIVSDPYALLDKHLGVPFFDSFLSIIAIRFKVLNETDTSHYLGTLLAGMENANSFLSDGLFFSKVFELLGEKTSSIVKAASLIEEPNSDISCLLWQDLLTAMGVENLNIDDDSVFWISEANLRSLDRVWHGEKMRPAMLADKLTSRGRGFGKK